MIKTGITRRQVAAGLASSAAMTGICPPIARAQQNYPSRPVRFILPFGAAGVADITSRLAVEKLGDRVSLEHDPRMGLVKDLGSAAVGLSLLFAAAIWLLAFAERMGLM